MTALTSDFRKALLHGRTRMQKPGEMTLETAWIVGLQVLSKGGHGVGVIAFFPDGMVIGVASRAGTAPQVGRRGPVDPKKGR